MTFKQKLAERLISEIDVCDSIANQKYNEGKLDEFSKWVGMVSVCKTIAFDMFGVDALQNAEDIINELKKFTKK